MVPDWLLHALGLAGTAVAVYAGIRADLAAIRAKAEGAAHAADQAHKRIDNLLLKG